MAWPCANKTLLRKACGVPDSTCWPLFADPDLVFERVRLSGEKHRSCQRQTRVASKDLDFESQDTDKRTDTQIYVTVAVQIGAILYGNPGRLEK